MWSRLKQAVTSIPMRTATGLSFRFKRVPQGSRKRASSPPMRTWERRIPAMQHVNSHHRSARANGTFVTYLMTRNNNMYYYYTYLFTVHICASMCMEPSGIGVYFFLHVIRFGDRSPYPKSHLFDLSNNDFDIREHLKIPAFRSWRQEKQRLKVIFGYSPHKLEAHLCYLRFCLKK